jgi:signal peptidase I
MKLLRTLKQRWSALNDWLRAFLLAVVLLTFVHLFLLRFVSVQSTSMFAALWPGDLVLVERWRAWGAMERNDIVVFRDPLKDDVPAARRPLLVKRIVGMPGDVVELRDGRTYVNGNLVADAPATTHSYLVRFRTGSNADSLLGSIGLPPTYLGQDRRVVEVPLNETLAEQLRKLDEVVSVERMGPATGAPRHIFPFSPYFQWNSDDYGPITVPRKGDTARIDVSNLPLYDRLISVYEGHRLGVSGRELTMDDKPFVNYVFEQDHYFVLGDSRHHSADSRYWGFLPGDHLVGRASLVLLSKGPAGLRSGRWLIRP